MSFSAISVDVSPRNNPESAPVISHHQTVVGSLKRIEICDVLPEAVEYIRTEMLHIVGQRNFKAVLSSLREIVETILLTVRHSTFGTVVETEIVTSHDRTVPGKLFRIMMVIQFAG